MKYFMGGIWSKEETGRVRNLKFTRNLKFANFKTLVNSVKKMMFCLELGMFQLKKP